MICPYCECCECMDCEYKEDCGECGNCDFEYHHDNGCVEFLELKGDNNVSE